ncbi:hypothetical protein HRbin15_01746 [bacterium HR15]|nr:hypothetical protein HRbin15_01746 [bacterium HR15]
MPELLVLLQALLLVAGWLLFLRAQAELRAQAARRSLTGEMEELRRTLDALLVRLTSEAEAAEARVQASIATLQPLLERIESACTPLAKGEMAPIPPPPSPTEADGAAREATTQVETSATAIGYNLSESEMHSFGIVAMLAQQGLSVQEIARQTGYAPGEVELILNLQQRRLEEEI